MTVHEGKFSRAKLEGYGRIFDVDDYAEATVQVGFFTKGKLEGKGEIFDDEGNVK